MLKLQPKKNEIKKDEKLPEGVRVEDLVDPQELTLLSTLYASGCHAGMRS